MKEEIVITPLALLTLVVVGFAVAASSFAVGRADVSARDLAWVAGGSAAADDEAVVYRRYLQRHRRHRLVGAWYGAALATVIGVRWMGTVTVGVGAGNPLGDLLFCVVAGLVVGALSAETYRLSDPPSARVTASLAAHPPIARPGLVRAARLLGVSSLVVGTGVAATGRGLAPLLVSLTGVVVGGLAELTQSAIVGRRRPLLSDRAHDVDLRIRAFASTRVALLELAVAVLTAAWTIAKIPEPASGAFAEAMGMVVAVVSLGGLAISLVLVRRASTHPPRSWRPTAP